jgi:hypothetical protein
VKPAKIENLIKHDSGAWSWFVRSADPDDAGKYRTGPGGKGLWKQYNSTAGSEYRQIQGDDFDLSKVKNVKGKLERTFE